MGITDASANQLLFAEREWSAWHSLFPPIDREFRFPSAVATLNAGAHGDYEPSRSAGC